MHKKWEQGNKQRYIWWSEGRTSISIQISFLGYFSHAKNKINSSNCKIKDINECNFYICLIVNWESHKSIAINLIKPHIYWGVLGAKTNFNSVQTSDRFPKDFICFCSVSF
jgi:hypothetical protein